jgi:hypothetical protein
MLFLDLLHIWPLSLTLHPKAGLCHCTLECEAYSSILRVSPKIIIHWSMWSWP